MMLILASTSNLMGLELVSNIATHDVGANDTPWLQECPTCISVTVFKSRYDYQLP